MIIGSFYKIFLTIIILGMIGWVFILINSLLNLSSQEKITKSGQSEVSINYLVAKAGFNILLIVMINFLMFFMFWFMIPDTNDKLQVLVYVVVGTTVTRIIMGYILKSKSLFPDNYKEELLNRMDVFHQAGFTMILTIVVLIMTIVEPEEEKDYIELNFLLAMLPYTIFAMARKMNETRKPLD